MKMWVTVDGSLCVSGYVCLCVCVDMSVCVCKRCVKIWVPKSSSVSVTFSWHLCASVSRGSVSVCQSVYPQNVTLGIEP